MSSYLKSDPSQVADFNGTEYNFEMFSTGITERQNKYDINKEKINNYYNSLLNSELSRTDNQELRDQYVQGIQDKIKQLASVDLSINANVAEASKIFTPFLEDKYIRSDMYMTASAKKAHAEAQKLKTSTNKDKNEGEYWSGGEELIDYELEFFKNANRENTLNSKPIQYTPAVDVNALLLDKAEEYKFNVSKDMTATVTADGFTSSPNGEYIITTVNGDLVTKDCASSFFQMLNQDPAYQEYAKARARLDRYRKTYAGGYDFQTARNNSLKYREEVYNRITKNTLIYNETLGKINSDLEHEPDNSVYKEKLESMKQHYEGLIASSNEHLSALELSGIYTDEQLDELNAKMITSDDATTRAQVWTTMTESQKVEQNPVVANIYREQAANYRAGLERTLEERRLAIQEEELKLKQQDSVASTYIDKLKKDIKAKADKIFPVVDGVIKVSRKELKEYFKDVPLANDVIDGLTDSGDTEYKFID